jgi:hypothetical protein
MNQNLIEVDATCFSSIRRSHWAFSLSLCLMLLAMLCTPARGQVGSASLSGIVQDQTGAIVPGATVTLQNAASDALRTSHSNGSGSFTFSAVLSGDYNLTVQASGFKRLIRSSVHLNPGDSLALTDLHLDVGDVSQTVSVNTTVASLPLDSGQLSSTITANDLDRLSVEGRDATELQKILPGFAIRNQTSSNEAPDFSQVEIGQPTPYASNGAPVAGITLKLDGASLTDPGNFGANLQNINDSFVSEVQVQTSNFGADQSNGPVIIQAVTKAGTDKYHGSLYTFARTSQLNSNDWLAKFNDEARPADRYIYPGGTLSGPVPGLKKLTFFVGAEYDAQRNIYAYGSVSEAIIHALVPTAAMRTGDFSTASLQSYLGPQYTNGAYANLAFQPTFGLDGTALTTGNIAPYLDPGAMALVKALMPLPTGPTGTDGYNYTTENLTNNNVTTLTGRMDYDINPKNIVFGRYTFEKQKQGQPQVPYYSPEESAPAMGDLNTPGGGFENAVHVHSAAANYVSVITPSLTNELYATLTYFLEAFDAKTPSALESSTIGYPYQGIYANGSKDWPQLQDYGDDGLPVVIPPDISYGAPSLKKFLPNGGDNLTKAWGTHTVKVGAFVERETNNQTITNGESNGAIFDYFYPAAGTQLFNYAGQNPDHSPAFDPTPMYESGNSLANFMEGVIQDFQQQNYLPRTNLYFWTVDGYAQDTWHMRPNFVVNYGVRIDHMGPWDDAHDLGASVWEPSLYAADVAAGSALPGFRWHAIDKSIPNSGSPAPPTYFEPRAGFSWDMFKTGKTVLRGGVGAYRMHDSVTDVTTAFSNAQGLRTATLFGFVSATLGGISSLGEDPATYGGVNTTAFGLSTTDNKEPVTNNYSLSLAQQLPNKSGIVQFSYVGNNSNSLFNNGTTQAVTLNNLNAIPIGTLYTPAAAALLNAATPGTCAATGCTPAQVAGLPATGTPATAGTPGSAGIQVVRPFPAYTSLTVPQHNTYANYNALQILYIKQAGHLNFNLNYTYSKALGILGSAADFNWTAGVNPFSIPSNYGPMNFDRSQVFNASYSYSVGKVVQSRLAGGFVNGWLISGITNLQSGPNMQTGVSPSPNFNLTGNVGPGGDTLPVNNQVVLGTPDVSLQPTILCNLKGGLAAHQYINGACFGVPAIGTNGQYIMPYVHGPAFFNSDLTAEKGFGVGHGRELRLRIAAFNFLNHPLNSFGTGYAQQLNLNLSDAVAGGTYAGAAYSPASGFGFAPQKLGRRLLEVSAKFNF